MNIFVFKERRDGKTIFGGRTQSAVPDVLRDAANPRRRRDVHARRRRLYGRAHPLHRYAAAVPDARAVRFPRQRRPPLPLRGLQGEPPRLQRDGAGGMPVHPAPAALPHPVVQRHSLRGDSRL